MLIFTNSSKVNSTLCYIFTIPGVLWTGGFPVWLRSLINVDIFALTHCKLLYMIFHFCQHYSSWLLVVMSLEKLFTLYFPLCTKSICTVSTAKKLTFASAVVFLLYDGQSFVIRGLKTRENGVKYCGWVNIPEGYNDIFWQIDVILCSFGPIHHHGFCQLHDYLQVHDGQMTEPQRRH